PCTDFTVPCARAGSPIRTMPARAATQASETRISAPMVYPMFEGLMWLHVQPCSGPNRRSPCGIPKPRLGYMLLQPCQERGGAILRVEKLPWNLDLRGLGARSRTAGK